MRADGAAARTINFPASPLGEYPAPMFLFSENGLCHRIKGPNKMLIFRSITKLEPEITKSNESTESNNGGLKCGLF